MSKRQVESIQNVEVIPTAIVAGLIVGRCGRIHADRDVDGEVFSNCVPCQVELLSVSLGS